MKLENYLKGLIPQGHEDMYVTGTWDWKYRGLWCLSTWEGWKQGCIQLVSKLGMIAGTSAMAMEQSKKHQSEIWKKMERNEVGTPKSQAC